MSKHLTGITALKKFSQIKDIEWLEDVYEKLGIVVEES
ncbi:MULTISPECIES: H-NS family histone-like protein [Photorhabdus]